jgi:hypothetical protein
VTYRASIEPDAVRQVHGIPGDVLDELVRLLARICDDPYDAVLSVPALPGDMSERMAVLGGGRGFVEFRVDEEAGLVRVSALAWTG